MSSSRSISFGARAGVLFAILAGVAGRPAPAHAASVVYSGYKILYYEIPTTGEVGKYGHYLFTQYSDGRYDTGGSDQAYSELVNDYHIPRENVWFADEDEDNGVEEARGSAPVPEDPSMAPSTYHEYWILYYWNSEAHEWNQYGHYLLPVVAPSGFGGGMDEAIAELTGYYHIPRSQICIESEVSGNRYPLDHSY